MEPTGCRRAATGKVPDSLMCLQYAYAFRSCALGKGGRFIPIEAVADVCPRWIESRSGNRCRIHAGLGRSIGIYLVQLQHGANGRLCAIAFDGREMHFSPTRKFRGRGFPAAERRHSVAWGVSPRNWDVMWISSPEGAASTLAPFRCRPFGARHDTRRLVLGLTPQATLCRPFGTRTRSELARGAGRGEKHSGREGMMK